jgi:hypothetical protein
MNSKYFNKNPRLKDQRKDGRAPRARLGNLYTSTRKLLKRRPSTNDEEDNMSGPKDLKRPMFMVTKVSREDVNKAFGKDIEGNFTLFNHIPLIMATKTLPICDAWIIDSRCAQHVCNTALRFI